MLFANFWLFLLYFRNKINFLIPSNYFILKYNKNNDFIAIEDVSFICNIMKLLNCRNQIYILSLINRFLNYDLNNKLIEINNNHNISYEDEKKFKPIIPKGIISTIRVDIKNHRYDLNNLKKNIFKIDKEVPLIFCLKYFEGISKINDCRITLGYRGNSNVKSTNINHIDKICTII